MATRYFNWKLAIVLTVAIAIFAVAAYALHRWQVNTWADQARPLGEKAYVAKDYETAARELGRYIAVNSDNVPVLLMYADAQLKRRPMTSNNVQQAIQSYRTVLRLERGNTEATRRLMEVYMRPPRPALGEAELIARRHLESGDDVAVRRMLADALWQQRKPGEAAAELQTILDKHPGDVLAYERMGMLAEQYPDAVSKKADLWFEEAVARNPQSALAYIVRGGFHLRRNDREKALVDLERAEALDLSVTEARLRLIGALRSANALDKAREHLKALHAGKPDEPLLWQHWAALASRANSPDEMYMVAQTGMKELAAQSWDFMPVATELLIRSGHLETAADYIAQMRQKDILPPATAFLEGLLAERQGQLREAITGWRKALMLGYRDPMLHRMLAFALARLGDTQSAIGQLRILLTENPGYLEGHMDLAQLLAQTRDWQEVLDQALQIQQMSPGQADAILLELQARVHLLAADTRAPADARLAAQRVEEWQGVETRLAQLDKTNEGVLGIKLLQTQVAMFRGKLTEATSMLKDLEGKYPSDTTVMLLHAELCMAEGKTEEARARFQEAVAKSPQAFEPVRRLALFLVQQNQPQECEAALKEGIARIEAPHTRRDLGLILADFYRQWKENDKLYRCLKDLALQFPGDIQPRRLLLTCDEVVKDPGKAQAIVDEIQSLEGERGWQWRYEQARLWHRSTDGEFTARYAQIVKLLQENLVTNPKDHASRLLLADTYEKADELPLAVTTYREALNLSPNNVPILLRTITALRRAQEFDEAQVLLDRADQQNLHHPDLETVRLEIALRTGNLPAASVILEKRISQDPNDASSRLYLALVRMRERKFEEAGKILSDLKAQMPDSISVTTVQINLCIQQGNVEEAIRLCDEMVKSPGGVSAYMLRARTYASLNRNERALEDFGRVIALEPKKAESWAARADFYRTIGRIHDGISDVRQALALSPDHVAIRRLAVGLFIATRDLSLMGEAEALVDKALAAQAPGSSSADDAQFQLLKAQILIIRATGPGIEQARRMLREITISQPTLAEAWVWMAQLELDQEDTGKALDLALRGLAHNPDNGQLLLLKARAEKARSPALAALTLKGLLDQNPRNAEILIQLADAYARAGRPQQAAELLRQKLAEFNGRERRRCEIAYAEALYGSGQKEEARSLFETLTQAEPNDPTPTMAQAQVLRRERRWTEMNQLVRRWLGTHPKDADVATTIAKVLAATGDKEALLMGEDILRTTLAQNPDSLPTLMLLGMMMQDAGRSEESAKLYRRMLELDPANVIAMNNLAWILCEKKNTPDQYREALALAERAFKIVPEYMDLFDTRGYVYYQSGNFEKATLDFLKCIELYPANSPMSVTPRLHLAMTYAAMKHKTQAAEQLQKALSVNREVLVSAKDQADSGRKTYAIKLLRDGLKSQEQMEPLKAALDLPGQAGGPSAQEVADARGLLDQLQKGTY